MSKISKLVKRPKLFFKDFIKKNFLKKDLKFKSSNIFTPQGGFSGGIDSINTVRIKGWILSENIDFTTLNLVYGDELISKTKLYKKREESNKSHKSKKVKSFSLKLTPKSINMNKKIKFKLIALNESSSKKVDLKFVKNNNSLNKFLFKLYGSEFVGFDGNVDGLINQKICGWIAVEKQNKKQIVWLQTKDENPIPFSTDIFREDIVKRGYFAYSGFSIDILNLPRIFYGKKLWLTFDKSGNFIVPQKKSITLDKKLLENNLNNNESKLVNQNSYNLISYKESIQRAPKNLKPLWEELENFRNFLDIIENETKKIETKIVTKNYVKNNYLKNFFNKINSNSNRR